MQAQKHGAESRTGGPSVGVGWMTLANAHVIDDRGVISRTSEMVVVAGCSPLIGTTHRTLEELVEVSKRDQVIDVSRISRTFKRILIECILENPEVIQADRQ